MKRSADSTGLPAWIENALFGAVRLAAIVSGSRVSVRVVVCKVDRLGDWLLAAPAIKAILAQAAGEGGRTVLWASTETRALRAWDPIPAPVEEVPFHSKGLVDRLKKLLRVAWLLGKYRTQQMVYLRHEDDLMHRLVVRHCQADRIIAGPAGDLPSGPPSLDQAVPRQILRHAAVLSLMGLPAEAPTLRPRFQRGVPPAAPQGILLAPFASTEDRNWKDTSWAATLDLMGCRGAGLTIVAADGQAEAARALADTLRGVQGLGSVAVVTRDLPGLVEVLCRSELVLAVDSFVAHLAIAHDLRTVALVGGGQFGEFAPWSLSRRQEWVTHPLPCFGCQWDCTRPAVECLEGIPPAAVSAAARRVLGSATA